MYLIQKCINNSQPHNAAYNADERYSWVNAWQGSKSRETGSYRDAISSFFEKTSKVRKAAYRLICIDSMTVVAAINTSDADSINKWHICAVGINESIISSQKPIIASHGKVVSDTGGLIAGGCYSPDNRVQVEVQNIAARVSAIVTTHAITTRFNSHGKSGGAWLVTSQTDELLTNTDVGISYSKLADQYMLLIESPYLNELSLANGRSFIPTESARYMRQFASLDETLNAFVKLIKRPTPNEEAMLAA